MTPRVVAKQLSQPTGIGGWAIRKLMNRGNARLNAYCIEQLQLTHQDRTLEIGFGGGVALQRLISAAAFVCGVDRSADVVASAARRFARAARVGRAEFRIGSVESLPVPDGAFDKVLSVNTVYFWASLDTGAAEIARVLKPGGRVVLGFLPRSRMDRMNMPPDIFNLREPEEVVAALARAGLEQAEIRRPSPETAWLAATAVRKRP